MVKTPLRMSPQLPSSRLDWDSHGDERAPALQQAGTYTFRLRAQRATYDPSSIWDILPLCPRLLNRLRPVPDTASPLNMISA
jgi:hypothetical protein